MGLGRAAKRESTNATFADGLGAVAVALGVVVLALVLVLL